MPAARRWLACTPERFRAWQPDPAAAALAFAYSTSTRCTAPAVLRARVETIAAAERDLAQISWLSVHRHYMVLVIGIRHHN